MALTKVTNSMIDASGSGEIIYNTALGAFAIGAGNGVPNTADGLTGIGYKALNVNTTGVDNTAVGSYVLRRNTTGSQNVGVGSSVFAFAETSSNNTGVGYFALRHCMGDSNTALGCNAGTDLATGTNNTYIGYNTSASGIAATGEIVIGQGSTGLGNNTTLIGHAATTSAKILGAVTLPSGVVGVIDGSNAAAGIVGEAIDFSYSPVALTSGVVLLLGTITLTAGDWDVSGYGGFDFAATTSVTVMRIGLSSFSTGFGMHGYNSDVRTAVVPGTAVSINSAFCTTRISSNASTTIYLIAQATFTISTATASGWFHARRVR